MITTTGSNHRASPILRSRHRRQADHRGPGRSPVVQTNGGSIGRIHHRTGTVTIYTDPPSARTAQRHHRGTRRRPRGSPNTQHSIGRITTAGVITTFTDSASAIPALASWRGRTAALWFTDARQRHDRANHHCRRGSPASRRPGIVFTVGDHGRAGRRACGSPTGNARSGASPPRGRHRLHGADTSAARWDHGRARRRAVVHQQRQQSIGRITTAGAVTNFTDSTSASPAGDHGGPDGALWFTNSGNRLDRAHHHRGVRLRVIPAPASASRGITAGPDGALWFTRPIGRITTAGSLRRFRFPAVSPVNDITTGSDGALWFTRN